MKRWLNSNWYTIRDSMAGMGLALFFIAAVSFIFALGMQYGL